MPVCSEFLANGNPPVCPQCKSIPPFILVLFSHLCLSASQKLGGHKRTLAVFTCRDMQSDLPLPMILLCSTDLLRETQSSHLSVVVTVPPQKTSLSPFSHSHAFRFVLPGRIRPAVPRTRSRGARSTDPRCTSQTNATRQHKH